MSISGICKSFSHMKDSLIKCPYSKTLNTFSTLGTIFSRQHFEIYFLFLDNRIWHFMQIVSISYFSKKNRSYILCKLSPMQTICMKCQSLIYGKNKKNMINLLSAEYAQSVVKVLLKMIANKHSWKIIKNNNSYWAVDINLFIRNDLYIKHNTDLMSKSQLQQMTYWIWFLFFSKKY